VRRIPGVKRAILADRSALEGLAWAVLAVAVPTLARWLIDRGEAGVPFVTYFPFILLSALLLGWRYAVPVAVLSGFIANRFLRDEPVLFYVGWRDAVMFTLFVVVCAILIYMGEQLRQLVRELEEAKAREELFSAELLHRAKNTLTIVGALASLTRRRSPPEEFFPAFAGRIQALNRATDLLVHENAQQRSIARLVEHAIAPFRSDGNFRVEGPDCRIPQASCMPLMLVLHELSTNAVKHGALTVPDGVVAITWGLSDGSRPMLALHWREHGGPPVEPQGHAGMGSALMRAQKGLRRIDFRLLSKGAECDIDIEGALAL
jgi:two-component sensor histidine kinase